MEYKRVTCYQNDEGEYLVLPWVKIGYGGKATSRIQRLAGSISTSELGRVVREQTEFCDESFCDPGLRNPLLYATGLKTMKAFANRWKSIVLYFDEQIRVSPTSRDSKGAYWELFKDTMHLSVDIGDEVLGQAILKAFESCKLGRRDY